MTTDPGTPTRRTVFYRGPRPVLRGYLHLFAFWFFLGTGTSLTVLAFATTGFSWLAVATAVYALCLAGMLGVSALYHRVPWKSEGSVQGWRRADHSMIAIFIAGTYGPIAVFAFDSWSDGLWILPVCWVLAIGAVAMNIFWIGHPRWLDVVVYLALGWLAVLKLGGFVESIPVVPGILIVVGGLVYSAGAVVYGRQRPNPSVRWFGFHEVFHAATIVAGGLHHIAIWILVLS